MIQDYIVDEPYIYYTTVDYNEEAEDDIIRLSKANMITATTIWTWEWEHEWDPYEFKFANRLILSPSKKYLLASGNVYYNSDS